MKMIEDIIIKPVITEASMDMLADENHKKYVFKVQSKDTSAWKKAIVALTADSKAIEFFEGLN